MLLNQLSRALYEIRSTQKRIYIYIYIYLPGVLKTGFPEVLSRIQLIAGNLSGHNLLKAVTFLG